MMATATNLDYCTLLSRIGVHLDDFFCLDCLVEQHYETNYVDTSSSVTAFCERCHRCTAVFNPLINAFFRYNGIGHLEASQLVNRYRVAGIRTDAWLMAHSCNLPYGIAFATQVRKLLRPASFTGGEDNLRELTDFYEAVYGSDLLPMKPAPDFLIDHPVSSAVTSFVDFLVELAHRGCLNLFYCQTCLSVQALPDASPSYSDVVKSNFEDVGRCCSCGHVDDVSNPWINEYLFRQGISLKYPYRYECNSDAYLIRDLLIPYAVDMKARRTMAGEQCHDSDCGRCTGTRPADICQRQYNRNHGNVLRENLHKSSARLTPVHTYFIRQAYQRMYGLDLLPIPFVTDHVAESLSPPARSRLTGWFKTQFPRLSASYQGERHGRDLSRLGRHSGQ